MAIVLLRKLNHRNITLAEDTEGETVGVLRRGGGYHFVPWLGFLDRFEAAELGRAVKLQVARVGRQDSLGWNTVWTDVPEGSHLQGCLTDDGVYAVVDQEVRFV